MMSRYIHWLILASLLLLACYENRSLFTLTLPAPLVVEVNHTGATRQQCNLQREFPSLSSGSRREKQSTPPLLRLLQSRRHPEEDNDVVRRTYQGEYGWRFQSYQSSPLEEAFYTDVRPFLKKRNYPPLIQAYRRKAEELLRESEGRVAPSTINDTNLDQCDLEEQQGVMLSESCHTKIDSPPPSKELFSRFIYEFVCLGDPCDAASFPSWTGWRLNETHTSYIEPLFGTMRHPRVFLDSGVSEYVLNKEYMMIDKWALKHLHTRYQTTLRRPEAVHSNGGACKVSRDRRSSLFVDLGASTYLDGGGGASQKWFVDTAACYCISFTDMFLFEATPHKPIEAWGVVPDYLHAHYRWYNYPVNASLESWRNPLNVLLSKVRPDDTVTVKIDFDTSHLEAQIIDTILHFPELFQTIDELFYEHHVLMPYMYRYWRGWYNASLNLRDSIDVFRALRRKGIRAHSWV
ncbi:Hypothetical protein, putative [Bodo saltans]|uniref:Membrane-associated protein n=1 Tax=Bodo saltans TaxID=75058 RepID=A0A0S4INI1_BODSA|nr:Hypothetical protein, putative [Bodo saltans]|eukprot:CUE77631.1 Hypothetical protein, putative [Bodo saltans]